MRIWDVSPSVLCRKHLLGEHRELHALWTILTENKKGYSQHPETLRWKGKLKALFLRHEAQVKEMKARGYHHHSDLNKQLAIGSAKQMDWITSVSEQQELLQNKKCECQFYGI